MAGAPGPAGAEYVGAGSRLASGRRLWTRLAGARVAPGTAPRRMRLLALGAARGLLGRLHPDADHLEVEVAWAVEQELALSLDDILARRLRLAIETRDHGASVAARVAAIVGPALGWDEGRVRGLITRHAGRRRRRVRRALKAGGLARSARAHAATG